MATTKPSKTKATKAPSKKEGKKVASVKTAKTATTKSVKKLAVEKVARKIDGLNVQVFSTDGSEKGTIALPKEVFGEKVNKQLMSQFVRVYLANQRQGGANTKTRGEVEGSSRKIYKQKGTGRARHGSIRAHIFVGGGVVFGPVSHDFSMTMPTKMKRKALCSALSAQLHEGGITVVEGFEKLEAKTKNMAASLRALGVDTKALLVLSNTASTVARITKNIDGVHMTPASSLNAYDVLTHKHIVFMKDAISLVQEIVTKA